MKMIKQMLFITMLMLVSGMAMAGDTYNESGPGPIQNHECQGGHNCNTNGHGTITGGDSSASAEASAAASAAAVSGSTSSASADSTNLNSNVSISEGGNSSSTAYGGAGGSAEQSQGQVQGQSQSSDNSNSSNNSSSQNVTFEGTGEAKHLNKYGNNVSAYAPAIYSSSACTAGGVSGGASGMGFGIALGGAKQDPQCQIRENARILSGLDTNLAILYLCANPGVDIGAVLGTACKPAPIPEPPVVLPPVVTPEPEQPIEVITQPVKG